MFLSCIYINMYVYTCMSLTNIHSTFDQRYLKLVGLLEEDPWDIKGIIKNHGALMNGRRSNDGRDGVGRLANVKCGSCGCLTTLLLMAQVMVARCSKKLLVLLVFLGVPMNRGVSCVGWDISHAHLFHTPHTLVTTHSFPFFSTFNLSPFSFQLVVYGSLSPTFVGRDQGDPKHAINVCWWDHLVCTSFALPLILVEFYEILQHGFSFLLIFFYLYGGYLIWVLFTIGLVK